MSLWRQWTRGLRRLVDCPSADVPGGTVGEALAAVFARSPALRGYIVDDQGALRRHVVVFVGGEAVRDRVRWADIVVRRGIQPE